MSGDGSSATNNYSVISSHGNNAKIESGAVRMGIAMVGVSGGNFSNLIGIQEAPPKNEDNITTDIGNIKSNFKKTDLNNIKQECNLVFLKSHLFVL